MTIRDSPLNFETLREFVLMFNLIFPPLCHACERILTQGEKGICTNCRHELPQTNYHLQNPNPIELHFFGRIAIARATSFLKFEPNNRVQHLLHELKYHGQQSIGTVIGRWFGSILKESRFFGHLDMVIPVPISAKRIRERGYNQVAYFAVALADEFGCECSMDILQKSKEVKSQVTLTAEERTKVLSDTFSAKSNNPLKAKSNLLLVDDLITTGATLEACTNTLHSAGYHNVNLATIAATISS